MPEENISIFRQELERVKAQFEEKFQDIMTYVSSDRENDKKTLRMINENENNDRRAIDQNRALIDKLETLLNVQNTMLSELRSLNNIMLNLSGGAAAVAGSGSPAPDFFGMGGDTSLSGNDGRGNDGLRYTGGGGNGGLRDTGGGGNGGLRDTGGGDNVRTRGGTTPSPTGTSGTGEISSDISNEDMAFEIYSAYRRAGFSHEQAKGLTGEVNRENNFNPDLIFGSHVEPADASMRNYGPLSYNQTRGENLLQYLRDQGLIAENGSIIRSRETLDAFGRFAMAEMTPEAEWSKDIPGAGSHAGMKKVQDFINNPDISEEESRRTMGGVGGYVAWARGQTKLRNGRPFDWEAHERRTMAGTRMVEELDFENRFSESIAEERTSDDSEIGSLLNKFNIDPNSLRFDEEGRLKNELYDTEGYPIRLSPKDAEELSQGLGIELPSTMEELRSDLASRDVAVEYEDRFSPGRPTSSNTQQLIRKSNETIRKYYAERLGLPEDISMKEIREYMLENDISSAPALKSIMIGEGGVEDIGGMFRNLEDVTSRVQPASGPHRTVSGRPAEHMDYSQAFLAGKLSENSPLRDYLRERETAEDTSGDDGVVEETQQVPAEIEGATADTSGEDGVVEETQHVPAEGDVVTQTFRGSGQWYKRPDGSRYLLQFGKIIREIPANDADGSADGSDTQETQQPTTESTTSDALAPEPAEPLLENPRVRAALESQDKSSFDLSKVGDFFDKNGNRIVPKINNNLFDLSDVVGMGAKFPETGADGEPDDEGTGRGWLNQTLEAMGDKISGYLGFGTAGEDNPDGDGGDGSVTPEIKETPLLGQRIPEETPTEFPTLAEQFMSGEFLTSRNTGMDFMVAGLNENPEVRAALEEQAAADTVDPLLQNPAVRTALLEEQAAADTAETTRETSRETPSGGYTGGGGDSREQEQPQIESNAIGRFPWAEKIIKYYNLSDMIKTNMLS